MNVSPAAATPKPAYANRPYQAKYPAKSTLGAPMLNTCLFCGLLWLSVDGASFARSIVACVPARLFQRSLHLWHRLLCPWRL